MNKAADNAADRTGIIAWFTKNPVAANLLMIVIIVVGIGSGSVIQRAMFPEIEVPIISIVIAYPGAAPEEVELGVVLKVEEALKDLEGIKRLTAEARESIANIWIEPADGFDLDNLMDTIKNRIDGIQHFPQEAEKPTINRWAMRDVALMLQIYGDLDERGMKNLAEEVKRELMAYTEVSMVEIQGVRNYEIGIEMSEHQLREYHLTLGEVADIINASSLNLPGGSVRTDNGDIMLRTTGQAYRQYDFEAIVLKTFPDGTRLTLGDIANVNDGFVDEIGFALFDGRPSVGLAVMAIGDQDELETAKRALKYVEQKNAKLPEGVELAHWMDVTYYLEERLGMMYKNLAFGALLVFIVLALFLEIKLAFWVMIGIPVCFFGAIAVFNLPIIGGSLNVLSLFGFILVLGIVVDDAIIIGESVYSEQERSGLSIRSVIDGTHNVATPATFGVLTTIMAFLPTLLTSGVMGALPAAVGWVVILCLIFSLVESKWILPAHLAHSKPVTNRWLKAVGVLPAATNSKLRQFIEARYRPFVKRCIANRYTTLAAFLSLLIMTFGLMTGGIVRYVVFPEVPADMIQAELKMADGTSQQQTLDAMIRIDEGLRQVERDYQQETGTDSKVIQHTFSYGFERINGILMGELTKSDIRDINSDEVMRRWRENVGDISGAEVLSFTAPDGPKVGPAISFDLIHEDFDVLKAAAAELEAQLKTYEGVYDVQNGASATSDEFHLDILPEAEALGLTRFDLGSQVRHAFYGAEAQRIQRGIDEIKVMVRYPMEDRHTTSSLDSMFIRTPGGDAVPFDSVAKLEVKPGLNKTNHINFQRAVSVDAEANKQIIEPSRVTNELLSEFLPGLAERYPDLVYRRSGMSDEEAKTGRSLLIGFTLALFGIYALLAIPTKSYMQPLIIMGAIPFGIIGAIVGHLITGYAFSMMSFFGVIALSGVVVNDSLIMVDFINRSVAKGTPVYQAVVDAGCKRFRAIFLTSLTTFFGLLPVLLETSVQAQQVVPMAVSLAFGIVFATVITLLLLPCMYIVLEDLKGSNVEKTTDPLATSS
ncbi:efflux RND transporter permease subunit [Oceanicoccus sagamiensis]|uniref:Acriflavin resistance protein n=1 Tax=Oceanicoccus sagamiensis TaxID=716816 RepID=A0A1X9NII5_9GAMM|nr:efflux RND transporter permease subunit [Oceanicoccus sagamiensis]ARN76202.1 acriflavin resistance protein [Oceanicoccus sagamiensis]